MKDGSVSSIRRPMARGSQDRRPAVAFAVRLGQHGGMTAAERGVRVGEVHDPKLIPLPPWYFRPLVWKSRLTGRLDFAEDGLWFNPDFGRLLRMERQRLAAWDDVLAIDYHPGRVVPSPLGLYQRDRTFRSVGMVRPEADQGLRRLGFEPHSKPSWPDRRLWTRPGVAPDWDLIHASTSSPAFLEAVWRMAQQADKCQGASVAP
jgi:hypothetical protein